MRKTFGRTGSTRRLRRGGVAAGIVALSLVAAACGGGGGEGGGAPQGGGGGPAARPVPPDAVAVTANTQQNALPQGTPGAGKPAVILGTKNFSEETLLGALYSQALQAKGYTVQVKDSIGGSELIDTALQSNQIQMYPEYLGEVVTSIAKQPSPTSASDTYNKAKQFQESRGNTILLQTPFEDVDTIVVTNQIAQQFGLKSVSDLGKIGPGGQGVTVAGPAEFQNRDTGLAGMKQKYNLPATGFLAVSSGAQYAALDQNAANAADAFSTDYQLTSGKYTALDDPQGVFGYQYVAPVIKQDVLNAQGPEFAATMNWVSSLLTTQAIQALNQQVQGNKVDPGSVARQFLQANGLK